MMPNVSPNSSLNPGPTTPTGSVWRMSPMLLRTWYQMSGTSLARVLSLRLTKIVVTPARVKLRRKSRFGVSCSVRSSRSVTCLSMSPTLTPGHAAWTTMVLMTNEGSSLRPSRTNANSPASTAVIIRETVSDRFLSAHSERLKPILRLQPEQPNLLAGMQGLYAGGDNDLAGRQSALHRG